MDNFGVGKMNVGDHIETDAERYDRVWRQVRAENPGMSDQQVYNYMTSMINGAQTPAQDSGADADPGPGPAASADAGQRGGGGQSETGAEWYDRVWRQVRAENPGMSDQQVYDYMTNLVNSGSQVSAPVGGIVGGGAATGNAAPASGPTVLESKYGPSGNSEPAGVNALNQLLDEFGKTRLIGTLPAQGIRYGALDDYATGGGGAQLGAGLGVGSDLLRIPDDIARVAQPVREKLMGNYQFAPGAGAGPGPGFIQTSSALESRLPSQTAPQLVPGAGVGSALFDVPAAPGLMQAAVEARLGPTTRPAAEPDSGQPDGQKYTNFSPLLWNKVESKYLIDQNSQKVISDAVGAIPDFFTGAEQGCREAYKQQEILDQMSTFDMNGHRIPKDGYTHKQLDAQQALANKAGEDFMNETVYPVLSLAGGFAAPKLAGAVAYGVNAAKGYNNTPGTTGEKLGGAVLGGAYGPLYQTYLQVRSGELGEKVNKNPGRALVGLIYPNLKLLKRGKEWADERGYD